MDKNNLSDPLCPALAVDVAPAISDNSGAEATTSLFSAMNLPTKSSSKSLKSGKSGNSKKLGKPGDIGKSKRSDIEDGPRILPSELPHCPKCNSLLRPGVVWFGEALSVDTIDTIEGWLETRRKVDLMLVIGTTAEVWPAASYIHKARLKGARVAVINMDSGHMGESGDLGKMDWMFEGDAGEILPILFEGVLEN